MKKHVFIIIYALLFCFTAHAIGSEEIIMVFGKNYKPYYLDNLEEGMYIDFLEQFEKQHTEFTIKKLSLPRKRMDLWMQSGKAHVFSLSSPLFYKGKAYLFTDPIWTTRDYAISKKSNIVKYEKPEDLFNVKTGIILGNAYGQVDPYIKSKQIKAQTVIDVKALNRILFIDRVSCILANKHITLYEMKNSGVDASQFYFPETPLYEFKLMPMVQPSHKHFVDAMNAFIKESNENGFMEKINEKYLK